MRRRPRRSAMTLLEVVLAVSLALTVMLGVMQFHDQIVAIREGVIREAELIGAERRIMDRVTDELRSAMVYPFLGIGMEGQAEQMQFVTACLPGPAAWAVRGVLDEPVPPEQDLQLVGYRLRIVEDEETGEWVVVGLERTCQKVISAPVVADDEQAEPEEFTTALLTPRIKFLYVRYWDGAGWQPSWGGGDLPTAVEITLGTEPLEEEMNPEDYPHPVFRRVVYVPGSTQALGGTIVRGLRGGPGP